MTRRHWIALGLITALGLILFTWDLGSKSMWSDEIGAVRIANEESPGAVFDEYNLSDQRQPPLYLYFLHAAIRVGGEERFPMRLPSSLFAVASIPLMAWVAHRIAGPRVALVSAFLLAMSPFVLLFGRMARPYPLALFLTLASTGFMIELLRSSKRSPLVLAGYVVTSVLLLLNNYVNIGTIIAQNLFFAVWYLRSRKQGETPRLKTWLLGQVLLWSLFAVWFAIDLNRFIRFSELPRRGFDVQGLGSILLKTTYPFYSFALGETIFPWHPLAIIGGIVFGFLTIAGLFHLRRLGIWHWLAPTLFVIPLALTVVAYVTIVQTHSFETIPSRAIGAFPFLLLIAALGIVQVRPVVAFALTGLLMITYTVAASNYFRNTDFHNSIYAVPTQQISELVRDQKRPGDLIVADEDIDFEYYHFNIGFEYWHFRKGRPANFLFTQDSEVREVWESGDYPRVWLITLGRDGSRGTTPLGLEKWIEENYELTQTVGFVPQDPTYGRLKESILGFPSYSHKALVRLYELKR